jgi:uncharacterized repeat protein (TIGR01451 family)
MPRCIGAVARRDGTAADDRRRARQRIAAIIAMAIALIIGTGSLRAQTVSLTKTVEPSSGPIASGEPFVYTLAYSWSGGAPGTLVIVDPLPSTLQYVSGTPVPGSVTVLHDPQSNTVTFKITGTDLSQPSGGGTVQITVRFPQGSTCDGARAVNRASIRIGSASDSTWSNEVVTTASAVNKWTFRKEVFQRCTADSTVIYRLKFVNPGGYGLLDLQNVAINEVLPSGASIVAVTPAPWTFSGTTITRTPSTLAATHYANWEVIYVTVKYPRPQFAAGQMVRNSAIATFKLPCNRDYERTVASDSSQLCDEPLSGKAALAKGLILDVNFPWNPSYWPKLVPDCCAKYVLAYSNAGNVPHTGLSLTDDVPPEIDVHGFYTTIPSGSSATVTIWRWVSGSCTADPPITVNQSGPGSIPSGAPVCKIVWSYSGSVAPGSGWYNYVDFCVRKQRFTDNTPVLSGESIVNTLSASASSTAGPVSQSVTHTKIVDDLGPKLVLTKQFLGRCDENGANPNGPFYPGDVVRYRIAIANLGNAAASNLTITDQLPQYLTFVGASSYDYGPHTAPVTANDPLCASSAMGPVPDAPMSAPTTSPADGDQALTWTFANMPGTCSGTPQFLVIDFFVKISADPPAPYGQYDNAFTVTASNLPGSQTSPTVTFVVNRIVAYTARKEVRVSGSGSEFSSSGEIPQGETAEFRLTITNTGNATLQDLCLLDIMPHVGDIQVIHTSPTYPTRGSALDLPLSGAITISQSGYDAGYVMPLAASGQPDRLAFCDGYCSPISGVVNPINPMVLATTTTTAFAPTFSFGVQAQSGVKLQPGETIEILATAVVPDTATVGSSACNSFAVRLADEKGVCMRTEASSCIVVSEPPSDLGGCIDFEDGDVSDWYGFFVQSITAAADGDRGGILKIVDGSGPSVAVDNRRFAGNWLERADASCLCFDYKVDWNESVGSDAGSMPKLVLYQGPTPLTDVNELNTQTLYASLTGIGSGVPIEDNEWRRFCLPIGLAEGTELPSNGSATWSIVQNGVPLTGAAAAAAWNQLIVNVSGLVLAADYNAQPSEVVSFDNFCWTCPDTPPSDCCDSASIAPGEPDDVQESKRVVTVYNRRSTPIEFIEVEYIDCSSGAEGTPANLNSGSHQASAGGAIPPTYQFPYAAYHLTTPNPYRRIPLTGYSLSPAGSIIRQDEIAWYIAANVADTQGWCITLKIHHTDGEVCIVRLDQWQPSADLAARAGAIDAATITGKVYAMSFVPRERLIRGRRISYVIASVADTADAILGGTGGAWSGAEPSASGSLVRDFVQTSKSARFIVAVDTPLTDPIRVFVGTKSTSRAPRMLLRIYDAKSRLLSVDTVETREVWGGSDGSERIAPGRGDVAIRRIAPNPASSSATFSLALGVGGDARLEVVDVRGSVVAVIEERFVQAGTHDITYDVSALPAGLYQARLVTKSGSASAVFQIVR